MPQITDPIPAQAFEVIRNRIGEILIDELENQVDKFYKLELDATVFIERFVPFDKTAVPAVNVSLARGDYDIQTAINSDGTYRFNIDCYHKAPSTVAENGDSFAMFKLQTLIGACRAILESPKYITLGFAAPFIEHREAENIQIAPPVDAKDGSSIVMGRLSFIVRVPENNDIITPKLIAGFDTQVKLGLTDKGYIYSGDNIPIPPVTGGTVTVNDEAFGVVEVGETLNIQVVNTYGDELGSKVGDVWQIPDQAYTDSDDSAKSVSAGDPIVCIPLDDARILDFEFGALGNDEIERNIGVNQAATYISNALTNIATVAYEVNSVVKILPFTVVDGDALKVTITRTVAATLSRVVLTGS